MAVRSVPFPYQMPCARPENVEETMTFLRKRIPENFVLETLLPLPIAADPYGRWLAKYHRTEKDEKGVPLRFPVAHPEFEAIAKPLMACDSTVNLRPVLKLNGGTYAFVVYVVYCTCFQKWNFDAPNCSDDLRMMKEARGPQLPPDETSALALKVAELLKIEDK